MNHKILFSFTAGSIVLVTTIMMFSLASPGLITFLCPLSLILIWVNGYAASKARFAIRSPFVVEDDQINQDKPKRPKRQRQTVEFN